MQSSQYFKDVYYYVIRVLVYGKKQIVCVRLMLVEVGVRT